MRHINSPKFLKRFLPSALTSASAATNNEVVEVQETSPISEENRTELGVETKELKELNEVPEPDSNITNEGANEAPEANINGVQTPETNANSVGTAETKVNGTEATEASGDESIDSDDRSESEWTAPEGDSEDSDPVEEAKLKRRYELYFPFNHIRKAQALWTLEERKSSPEWQELLDLLVNFFIKSPEILNAWQLQIGYTEETKRTAIQSACLTGLPEIVEMVLSQGADIDEVTKSDSPLHIAISIEHGLAVTQFLLDHGADPNRAAGDYSFSPFHICLIRNTDLTLIKEFFNHSGLRKPVSLTVKSFWGWTALHYLAYSRADCAVLDLLLDNGGNINIRNTEYMTPLHIILDRREIPLNLLRAFIDRGADVTAEDNDSESKSLSRLALVL